mgnify:CR=1 FL=1
MNFEHITRTNYGVDSLKTLLVEIGTEEIPARFIEPAKEGLLKLFQDGLNSLRIKYGNIEIQSTPRRTAVFVYNIADKQEEIIITKFGPPYNRAFDASGNPTKAMTGFAKSQGVEVDELKKGVKDGIEFVTVEKADRGKAVEEILAGLLHDVISKIPFQKRMKWGNENFEFARPIQWILAILNETPIVFTIADVKSGNITYGHRFLSKGPFVVESPSLYIDTLRENHIIVNEQERMDIILKGINAIEEKMGGRAIRDNDLIKEILYITECPYPLLGSFDETFLEIPKEVLVNVMKSHQRYIPVEDKNGNLLPYFIFFANTIPSDDKNVIRGNEKVLRARLADARFFFEEDKKIKLSDLYDRLSSIVFHIKLGSLKQKMVRVLKVALCLSDLLRLDNTEHIEKTVRTMKVDLLTHMVGEFPELQGIMGRIYALHNGEDEEVAYAIEEHYLPSSGNGALPQSLLGAIVSISDKIDSIISFFSVGIMPTGNLDPFALRRQTLGIIKIAIDKKLHFSMDELIKIAYESGEEIQKRKAFEETKDAFLDFLTTRFKFAMIDEGHNQEFVESVLPFVSKDIYDGYLRLVTLETQKSIEDFKRLMIGFKRAYNITKALDIDMKTDNALFQKDEEGALFALYESKKDEFFSLINMRQYDSALSILVGFKESIDNYFDSVFVMDKDELIKNNRLSLLKKIKDMFLTYGDFSKIRIE